MREVEDQYTKWVYPIPVDDMREAILKNEYIEQGDPLLCWPVYWPRKRNVDKLDILIAGCGTCQAAYYACRNPNWNVLGIDISETSLNHQRKLKEKHNLKNLRLKKMSLLDVQFIGETYDFIVSTGVLHHLPDPDSGLLSIKNVLRPEGVMNLMVYGKTLRLGVYMMQEVFKSLGFKQTQEDVDIVKETIKSLAANHAVKKYTDIAFDLHYDAAFVDTFLHPQDRAYSVLDIYEFTQQAGLEFLSWEDPLPYSLDAAIPAGHPLWKRLSNLSPKMAAHICDLLVQNQGTHVWSAGLPDYVKKIKIPFNDDSFYQCFVALHRQIEVLKPGNPKSGDPAVLKRGNQEIKLDPYVALVIQVSNMNKNILNAINEIDLSEDLKHALKETVRNDFHTLWRNGHIYLFLPEEK